MTTHADKVIELYRRHARAWANARSIKPGKRLMEAAWLDRFRSLLPCRPAVLDIGCGSGEPMARYLSERGCDLTGVDSSVELIMTCRGRLPLGNWYVADMRLLSLGRVFDGILAWDSFFHLSHDEQRRMFPVFRAHAAPRAVLMFTTGPAHGEAMGTFEGEPLYHASLDGAEYRALLAANGFVILTHVVEDQTCGNHTIWLAQFDHLGSLSTD